MLSERFEATKWLTRSARVCGLSASSEWRESMLPAGDVGDDGEAMNRVSRAKLVVVEKVL